MLPFDQVFPCPHSSLNVSVVPRLDQASPHRWRGLHVYSVSALSLSYNAIPGDDRSASLTHVGE